MVRRAAWKLTPRPAHPPRPSRSRTRRPRPLEERNVMIRRFEALAAALLGTVLPQPGPAQNPPVTILQIDIENWVQYLEDTNDRSLYATNANVTPASGPRNF